MKELTSLSGKKILIIAPHPDDETFCCAGILLKYYRDCEVVLLTDGRKGNPGWTESRTARVRKKEFQEVMKSVGIERYQELSIPDGQVRLQLKRLKQISYDKYDYIFVPSRDDEHEDHKCVYRYVKLQCWKKKAKAKIFEYEMWGALRRPTHFINISDVIELKKDIMRKYVSQQIHIDYVNRVLALNYYRAIGVPNAEYVECFYSSRN